MVGQQYWGMSQYLLWPFVECGCDDQHHLMMLRYFKSSVLIARDPLSVSRICRGLGDAPPKTPVPHPPPPLFTTTMTTTYNGRMMAHSFSFDVRGQQRLPEGLDENVKNSSKRRGLPASTTRRPRVTTDVVSSTFCSWKRISRSEAWTGSMRIES